jgi:hypothetical protein
MRRGLRRPYRNRVGLRRRGRNGGGGRFPICVFLGFFGCSLGIGWVFGGCRLFDSHRYAEILIPPRPEAWRGGPEIGGYRIEWPGGEYRVDADGGRVVLELPAERYVPVLAYPELGSSRGELRPAGGVTSLPGAAGTAVELSYCLGPAAELLRSCRRGDFDRQVGDFSPVDAFNVPRYIDEFLSRGGEDPWRVDLRRLEIALSTGNFRADLIRPETVRTLHLPEEFAKSGEWISGNPFSGVSESTAGTGLEVEITPGEHWYFSADGERWLHIVSDEEEWHAVSSRGCGLSGRW